MSGSFLSAFLEPRSLGTNASLSYPLQLYITSLSTSAITFNLALITSSVPNLIPYQPSSRQSQNLAPPSQNQNAPFNHNPFVSPLRSALPLPRSRCSNRSRCGRQLPPVGVGGNPFPCLNGLMISLETKFSPKTILPGHLLTPPLHRGVYCGSYGGQDALVKFLPPLSSLLTPLLQSQYCLDSWLIFQPKLYCNGHGLYKTCYKSCYIDQGCIPYTTG